MTQDFARHDAATTDVVIYHNPACATSRNTLALIRNAGVGEASDERSRVLQYDWYAPLPDIR